MMGGFFGSMDYLEPKCKHCGSKLVYDETTRWDEELGCQVCLSCGNPLEFEEKEQELDYESCTL
ncbi:MAG: hypothetical protein ACQESF_00960 [Nanobdellota archaeon]